MERRLAGKLYYIESTPTESAKYPKSMNCLEKDKASMLAFYDFPTENRQHIRTTNPIESVFATVRLRTTRSKNCGSRKTTLAMAFKLIETAQKRWQRLRGYKVTSILLMSSRVLDLPMESKRKSIRNRTPLKGLRCHTPDLTIARGRRI